MISVITPTRNAIEFLDECLESVASQRSADLEVEHIVIDSASVDGTPERAASFGATVLAVDPIGLYHSINLGVEQSKGDVLCVLGGDDTILPGALLKVSEWHEKRKNPWLIGAVQWTDSDGKPTGVLKAPPSWMGSRMYASLGWSCIQSQVTFVTRSFIESVGVFSEEYRYSGDYEFYARALRLHDFDRSNEVLATFRRHGRNMSMAPDPLRLEEDAQIRATYAPRSFIVRQMYRNLLRLWLNARNPGWFSAKHF
jgi:glycosyltransferase involved in cell wall biosynthesis